MGMFQKATREKLKLRMALVAPPKSGKTFCGLTFAFALAGPSGRVFVIDTENRSASKYAGDSPHGIPWNFEACELRHFAPSTYTAAIKAAANEGADVLLIDSLSHAWEGVGGALDQVDKKSSQTGNSFTAWKDVTPQHREMIETIIGAPLHVIVTMRTKMEYVLEETINRSGKKVTAPRLVGLAPVQRQGMEYEFDIVCDLDVDHTLKVGGTRCRPIDGLVVSRPGPEFMEPVIKWLNEGVRPVSPPSTASFVPPSPPTPAVPTATNDPTHVSAYEASTAPVVPNGHSSGLPGISTTSTLAAPATTFAPSFIPDDGPIQPDQRDTIIGLVSRIGEAKNWPQPESQGWLKKVLAKQGKQKLAELTYAQAVSLISFLEGKLTTAEAEMLFDGQQVTHPAS